MKLYYYFLFRIYWFFRDVVKEGHKMSLFSTSIMSIIILYFTLYGIVGFVYFFKVTASFNLGINYKFWIVSFAVVLWGINYYSFIKPRNFLRQDFKKDRKGGLIIIFVVLLIGILFVSGANKNREKIFQEKRKVRIENNL